MLTKRTVGLALEELENRLTPTVAPNALFVSSLYQGLLGRNVDSTGLTYWTGQLNAGATRTQVAEGIASSNEALNRDVNLFYDAVLNRPADNAGQTYWMNELASGESLDQVKAGILGSDEFFSDAGNTNEGFLNDLYVHELGRSLDAAGETYWGTQLNEGVTREAVADEVLASPEAANEKITGFYTEVLGHTPDAAGLNYWSAQLQQGVSETQVLAGLLGSNEYYSHVENLAATTATTDPNVAAANLIASMNLFNGPLPNAEYLAHKLPTTLVVVPAPVTQPGTTPPDASGGTINDAGNGNTGGSTNTNSTCDNTTCDNTGTTTCDNTDTTTADDTDNSTDTTDCSDTGDDSDNNYVDTTDTSGDYGDSGSTDYSDGSNDYSDIGSTDF